MISDHLIPELRRRFPDVAFTFGEAPNPVASVRSPCEAMGQMDIYDDGDEVTVMFNLSHGHFCCYDDRLSIDQRERQVAEDVVAFLGAVFEDRVVVWRMGGGMVAGCRILRPGEPVPAPSMFRRQCLWTREIT